MTRDTGQGVNHLCESCYELCSYDNQVNDDGRDCEQLDPYELSQRDLHIAKVERLGGDVAAVKKFCSFLFGPIAE